MLSHTQDIQCNSRGSNAMHAVGYCMRRRVKVLDVAPLRAFQLGTKPSAVAPFRHDRIPPAP